MIQGPRMRISILVNAYIDMPLAMHDINYKMRKKPVYEHVKRKSKPPKPASRLSNSSETLTATLLAENLRLPL